MQLSLAAWKCFANLLLNRIKYVDIGHAGSNLAYIGHDMVTEGSRRACQSVDGPRNECFTEEYLPIRMEGLPRGCSRLGLEVFELAIDMA